MVPAGRMKGGKEHRVPLSERAMELLRALPTEDGNDFVFLGSRSRHRFEQHDDGAGAQTHESRRRHRAWISIEPSAIGPARQRIIRNFVVEMALAHAIGDEVEAAYRRGDLLAKRRQLAEAWSKYCTSPPPAGAVLPMRRPA